MKKERPTLEELIAAIDAKKGNLAAVARGFGVSRPLVFKWVHKSATALEALETARETMIDNAESVLYKRVLEGHTAELIFFLKTQGRNRGYVERREYTGPDGGPLQIEYVNDWRGDSSEDDEA